MSNKSKKISLSKNHHDLQRKGPFQILMNFENVVFLEKNKGHVFFTAPNIFLRVIDAHSE